MSVDFTVYTSSHPDVLAAWESHRAQDAKWREDWITQVAAWGFDPEKNKPYVTDGIWGPMYLIGVHWGYGSNPLPTGWKRVDTSRNRHVLEPYRAKAKANPELQREFKALVKVPDIRRDLVPLGMPQHMFTGLRVTTYAVRLLTDPTPAVWVKWHGVDPLASKQWWDKISLSRYYAMVESGNDPFASDGDESVG